MSASRRASCNLTTSVTSLNFRLGLTDLCKTGAGMDRDVEGEPFDVERLQRAMLEYTPAALAFNGKKAAAAYFDCDTGDLAYGRQTPMIGTTRVYVLPSTAPTAQRYWDVSYWQAWPMTPGRALVSCMLLDHVGGGLVGRDVDHLLRRLGGADLVAQLGRNVHDEDLDVPRAQCLGDPAAACRVARGLCVSEDEDEPRVLVQAAKRDQFQRVDSDFLLLAALELTLPGEDLADHGVVGRGSIDVDG